MFAYASLLALVSSAVLVRAIPTPNVPGPSDQYTIGGECEIAWDVDPTGVWKEMNIQLMTGSNTQMVHLTTVATVDATDPTKTPFQYPCPDVTPHSAIYFYQFSTPADPTALTWTTRWTMAGADGDVTDPENPLQDDGKPIPWGTGQLVDASTAVPAPAYLTQGATPPTNSSSTTTTGSTTGSTTSAPTSSGASTTGASSSSSPRTAPTAPTNTAPVSNSTSNNSTGTGASGDNGAASLLATDSFLARAGIALGVAAFTFAVAL